MHLRQHRRGRGSAQVILVVPNPDKAERALA
jgi:hypothetical protein